jgi:alanyl-tRNA synthetase
MGDWYPELREQEKHVTEVIENEENAFTDMLQNGMKLLDAELPRLNGNILPGNIAFKLFDTYGFPLDLTQMILRDKNIDVDVDGFNAAMTEQKERSRADTRGTKTLWMGKIESDKIPETNDTDKYAADKCTASGRILAILRDGEFVDSANDGDNVEVALDRTPFYGTQGGQVGDSGSFETVTIATEHINGLNPDGIGGIPVMNVEETFRIDNVVIHKGVLLKSIKVGDYIKPKISNNVRVQTARAHTAAHLLQAALRQVLNDDVEQRGSRVGPDSVRFDFSFGRAMTAEEKQAVEDLVNSWIAADIPVKHEIMSLDDAKQRGAMALFGEKYGDTVRVISAGDISCELCGGTHIYHTGEIIRARINKEKSISSGIRRITMSVGTLAE